MRGLFCSGRPLPMSGGTTAGPVDYRALRISVAVRLERYAAAVGTAKSRVTAFAQLLTSKSKAVTGRKRRLGDGPSDQLFPEQSLCELRASEGSSLGG